LTLTKKIQGAIYEPRFLNCVYGFRPSRGCHEAIKEVYQRISYGKVSYTHGMDLWKCSSITHYQNLKRTIVYIEANVTMRGRMRENRTYGSVRG